MSALRRLQPYPRAINHPILYERTPPPDELLRYRVNPKRPTPLRQTCQRNFLIILHPFAGYPLVVIKPIAQLKYQDNESNRKFKARRGMPPAIIEVLRDSIL